MNNINEQDEHEEEQGDETYGEKCLLIVLMKNRKEDML